VVAGLRRLKLATIRTQAAEILQTARTQRWPLEDVLRTLVIAEITARDQTNRQLRLKAANLPVHKSLDAFDTLSSSIPHSTFNYVASLEWVRAKENLLLVGPAGTGKSHVLIGVGLQAVEQGLRVRYATAADLIEQLYRGLADNTVSRSIDSLLRNDVILIDEVGCAPRGAMIPRGLRDPPPVAAAAGKS
jgi:DNA replication protein DnaC